MVAVYMPELQFDAFEPLTTCEGCAHQTVEANERIQYASASTGLLLACACMLKRFLLYFLQRKQFD